MATGNASVFPPKIWFNAPETSKLSVLFLRSVGKVTLLGLIIFAGWEYRSLSWKYTYKNFIGRTIIFGQYTQLSHEPLTVEEVDKLKEQQRQKKLSN